MSDSNPLTVIDLFAGVGGIRLGFEYAFNRSNESKLRLETQFACEIDPYARQTYSQNFPIPEDEDFWGYDIRDPEVQNLIKKFDICLAGFPCQAFSKAGHRKGFEDEKKRGTLFFEVKKICTKNRPAVIFCENVRGLFNFGRKGEDGYHEVYATIRNELVQLGYEVFEKILNSADFGVPQSRERLYIVCFRKDIYESLQKQSLSFVFPKNNEFCEISKSWESHKLEDIRQAGPIDAKYYLSERYFNTLKRHKETHKKKGNGFGYVIREWDQISGTILCGNMGRERNLVVDYDHKELIQTNRITSPYNQEHVRRLTPTEYMRLQGFPRDFSVQGVSDIQLYKQFGNTVTVPVIEAIAREIRVVLENVAKTGKSIRGKKGCKSDQN